MEVEYIFKSERLGFRNWIKNDLKPMAAINSDSEVMQFFPNVQTEGKTQQFIERMQCQFEEKGFCYFAVDKLDGQEFIGFIGLSEQTFKADFTPCIDIGWRLAKRAWGCGYATEGALKSLDYAFNSLELDEVLSIASTVNLQSINVMEKIGMKKVEKFEHPVLKDDPRLKECVLYSRKKIQ